MTTSIGARVQTLEKIIIANMKETGLVEHPHIYHGDLKNPREPISISYKSPYEQSPEDIQKRGLIDPFYDEMHLIDDIRKYPGVLEYTDRYDENTGVHTMAFKLDHTARRDMLEFKFEFLRYINGKISSYIIKMGGKPGHQDTFRQEISKVRDSLNNIKQKKGKKHKK